MEKSQKQLDQLRWYTRSSEIIDPIECNKTVCKYKNIIVSLTDKKYFSTIQAREAETKWLSINY